MISSSERANGRAKSHCFEGAVGIVRFRHGSGDGRYIRSFGIARQCARAFETSRDCADRSGGVHGAVVCGRAGRDAVLGARLWKRLLHAAHHHRGKRLDVERESGAIVEPGNGYRARNGGDRPVH